MQSPTPKTLCEVFLEELRMKHICAKCGALAEVKHPALVAAGKAMAARLTSAQRRAYGAKGGSAKRKARK